MTSTPVSRRRFIGIVAATSALTCVPWAVKAMQAATTPLSSWQGVALGADAQLHIHHPDPVFAQTLIDQALSEVRRLERIFSLYQEDSALRRLNRDGYLKQAPGDLTRLLLESQRLSELTNGAFDPTVQVLWELYSQAVQRSDTTSIPTAAEIKQTLQQVGHQAIHIQDDTVQLQRPGMALTLNGIAQDARIVDDEARFDGYLDRPPVILEPPPVQFMRLLPSIGQADMPEQVSWMVRHGAGSEVLRRTNHRTAQIGREAGG